MVTKTSTVKYVEPQIIIKEELSNNYDGDSHDTNEKKTKDLFGHDIDEIVNISKRRDSVVEEVQHVQSSEQLVPSTVNNEQMHIEDAESLYEGMLLFYNISPCDGASNINLYIFALTKQETFIGRSRCKLHYPDIFLRNLGCFFSSISACNCYLNEKDNCFVYMCIFFFTMICT